MMQTAILKIAGMEHEGCADKLSALLGSMAGVSDVRVSLLDAQVSLQLDDQLVTAQVVARTLEAAGYPSFPEPPAARGKCANCCGGGGCGKTAPPASTHQPQH